MKPLILIVDDEPGFRFLLTSLLERAGFAVQTAPDRATFQRLLEGPAPDLVILDLVLPDSLGVDLLAQAKSAWPATEVIMVSGSADLDAMAEAARHGAFYCIEKPFNNQTMLWVVQRAVEFKRLRVEARSLREALLASGGKVTRGFPSSSMKALWQTMESVAAGDAPLFITGEPGSGKQVMASWVHACSPRSQQPLIKGHCPTLGSRANAMDSLKAARSGTLLLVALDALPQALQYQWMRALRRAAHVAHPQKPFCRILATLEVPLEDALDTGRVSRELSSLLNPVTLAIPPLRERRQDILPLAQAFLEGFAAQANHCVQGFSAAAADRLSQFNWPGNVRQLQNEVQRAVWLCDGPLIQENHLCLAALSRQPAFGSARLTLSEQIERNLIQEILRETGGNKVRAAQCLGIGRQTLYNKLKSYRLNPENAPCPPSQTS